MEYPQITQISAPGSGRAKRTGRARGVPQVKGAFPRPRRNRRAAKRGLYLAGGKLTSAEICVICVICGS